MLSKLLCAVAFLLFLGRLTPSFAADEQATTLQLRHVAQVRWGEGAALTWPKEILFMGCDGKLMFHDPKRGALGFLDENYKEKLLTKDSLREKDLPSLRRAFRNHAEGPVSTGNILLPADSMCSRDKSTYLHLHWDFAGESQQVVQCVRHGHVAWTWAREWQSYDRQPRDPFAMVSDSLIALVRPDKSNMVALFDREKGFVSQIGFARPEGSELRDEDLPLTVEEEVKRLRPEWFPPGFEQGWEKPQIEETEEMLRGYAKMEVERRLKKLGKEKAWLEKMKRVDFVLGDIDSLYAMEDGSLVAVDSSRERAVWFATDGQIIARWPAGLDQGRDKPTAGKTRPRDEFGRIIPGPAIIGTGSNVVIVYQPQEQTVQLVDRQSKAVAELSMVFPNSRISTADQKDALRGFGRDARALQIDARAFAVIDRRTIYLMTLQPVPTEVKENNPPRDFEVIPGPNNPPE